jgi:hypothetical protein
VGIVSQAAEIILLAEDVRQRKIIHRYLTKKRGYSHRCIRTINPEVLRGETAGLTFVRANYAEQVAALRTFRVHRSTVLVVVADADNETVEERIRDLDHRLVGANLSTRAREELIVLIVPRRNVETWMYFLAGNSVDETTEYKAQCSNLDDGEFARRFADFAYPPRNRLPDCPDSLRRTCQAELPRIP